MLLPSKLLKDASNWLVDQLADSSVPLVSFVEPGKHVALAVVAAVCCINTACCCKCFCICKDCPGPPRDILAISAWRKQSLDGFQTMQLMPLAFGLWLLTEVELQHPLSSFRRSWTKLQFRTSNLTSSRHNRKVRKLSLYQESMGFGGLKNLWLACLVPKSCKQRE